MEVIKRNKTAQRTSFTKAYNKLDNLLIDENIDYDEIEMCLGLFKQKADALELTHNSFLDSLPDKDCDFETEFNSVEEYREKALIIQLKAQRLLDKIKIKLNENKNKNFDSNQSGDEVIAAKSMCYRLPEVELYKFGGDLKDWLTFWNQFKSIHENKTLSDTDKFNYLIQSTKLKSEAREIVESFPITNENYTLAIDSLTERYGKKDILIDFYVRELLKLVLHNATKRKNDTLSSLYNKLSTQIRALGSLGVTTEMCGVILYPLVESALPVNILRSFERQRKHLENEQKLSNLEAIILFLKNEVHSEEKIKLSRTEFCNVSFERKDLAASQNSKNNYSSAAELINHKQSDNNVYASCFLCSLNHETRFCKKAFYMPMKEKFAIIKQKGLCRTCLAKGHLANFCRSNIKCQTCSKRHVKFMCPNLEINKFDETSKQRNNDNNEKTVDTLHSRATSEVYLQTLIVILKGKNKHKKARIMIDTGSQKSYILKSSVQELDFDLQGEEAFSHSLFGGKRTKMQKHKSYKIFLSSMDGKYTCSLDALDQDIICNDISSIGNGSWLGELKYKGIFLTDTQENSNRPIEVLLGSDVAGKLFTGEQHKLKSGLVALGTKLGWTLIGKVPQFERQNDVNMTVVSMLSHEDVPVSALWDLELLGIRDPAEQNSREDIKKAVLDHFQETVQQQEDGRYEVRLPWKQDHAFLPDNYRICLKRLEIISKKLEQTGYREKYHQIFEEWVQEGVIEEVPEEDISFSLSHYLPHRPVIKESATMSSMKIRPVFDASAKTSNFPSLNDCLEPGINLIETIPAILARFRMNEIGVISDIRRAFLQISLHENDRNFLKFLWYDKNDVIKTFRHKRVVFGLTSSPFLLMAVIYYHLSKESLKVHYPIKLIEKLRDSFYVDNCVTSVKNITELDNFRKAATEVMEEGKFDLRNWESTAYPSPISKAHVLGLIWDKNLDTLQIDCESLKLVETEHLTKRKCLSLISRIFDPVGFSSPALIQPKLLLQTTWKTKEHWDSELPEEIKKKFQKWFRQLHNLQTIKIPRWLGVNSQCSLSVHTFVDASKTAYAACIFIRCHFPDGTVNIQLLQAKSRIAPLKKITIPRLELMGAIIGARLFQSVKQALKFENIECYFWTDSSTVLTWIKRQEQWSVFVSNRISEIRKLTAPEEWFHVPGDKNPADLLSRGCGVKQLLKSQWWLGPVWLKNPKEQWPKSNVNIDEEEINQEKRRAVTSASNIECHSIISRLAERISKFSKITRVLAWMLRFQPKSKDLRKYKNLTKEEILNAQKTLFRTLQAEYFSSEEGKKSLANFQTYQDDEKLLRLKSRLSNDDEFPDFISPIILPSKHLITKRLIEQEHVLNKHAGTSILLTILRERFWILNGKRTIQSTIRHCIACNRQKVKHLEVPFPPLPRDRTKITAVFENSGLDLAGPLMTKSKEKVWIVLFSCAVYRAVHLELIPSLSTNALIHAVRRFIARRGRISILYSDNGTNFTGLNTALRQLDWNKIENEFEVNEIRWKFNPPSAPWWGGFWERLIRILKDLLKRNLGSSLLTYEELLTLVCECEAIMNNRPLTYLSEEPELKTLTPSMFLQDICTCDVPDLDQIERTNIVKRVKYLQRIRENLKQRFRREYLGFLRSSIPKRHDEIKVGDIVLIGQDDKKRLHWPLAKVVQLFPGKDGIVRLVKLKTTKGTFLRPIQRLYPLEITNEHEGLTMRCVQNPEPKEKPEIYESKETVPIRTSFGRVVKPVNRLNL